MPAKRPGRRGASRGPRQGRVTVGEPSRKKGSPDAQGAVAEDGGTGLVNVVLGSLARSPASLVAAVERGIPTDVLDRLESVGWSTKDLHLYLLPPRLLRQRRQKGRLTLAESDHLVRLLRIQEQAERTFKARSKAAIWLRMPLVLLGKRSPFDIARTQVGAQMVETMLGAIAWGGPA